MNMDVVRESTTWVTGHFTSQNAFLLTQQSLFPFMEKPFTVLIGSKKWWVPTCTQSLARALTLAFQLRKIELSLTEAKMLVELSNGVLIATYQAVSETLEMAG